MISKFDLLVLMHFGVTFSLIRAYVLLLSNFMLMTHHPTYIFKAFCLKKLRISAR